MELQKRLLLCRSISMINNLPFYSHDLHRGLLLCRPNGLACLGYARPQVRKDDTIVAHNVANAELWDKDDTIVAHNAAHAELWVKDDTNSSPQ